MNSNFINPSGIRTVRTNHRQRYETRELDLVSHTAGETLDRLATPFLTSFRDYIYLLDLDEKQLFSVWHEKCV